MSGVQILLSIVGVVLIATALWSGSKRTIWTRRGTFEAERNQPAFWINILLLLALGGVCFWRAFA